MDFLTLLILFFQLIMGHAVADFVLQPNPMSSGKSRYNDLRQQYGDGFPQWYYWLTAHSLTHAGFVFVITGSATLALLELISHWLIDFFRCEKWISLHVDQSLHILCKIVYCVLIYYFQPI